MASRQKSDRNVKIRGEREWDRRPGLSRALRIAIFAGPVAASFAVVALLSHLLPRAGGAAATVLWIGVIAAASLATLVILERAARRLLPLAALLNLSLIFPDKAPARFAVARRTGRPRDLQASLQQAHETGHEDDARRMQTIIELVLALSVHDKASRGHSERVRVFTDLLAAELKIPESGRNRLRWAALLHDIGKLEVKPAILNKRGAPTEEEWAMLHRHPEDGARLVAPLLPWLGKWGAAVAQHHERYDGTGYPHRLKGRRISLAARIVAVADVYEVMTAPRPYKRPMSVTAARQGAGSRRRYAARSRHRPRLPQRLGRSPLEDHRLWRVDRPAPPARAHLWLRWVGELGDGDGHRHGDNRDRAGGQWRRRPRSRPGGSVSSRRVRSRTHPPADVATHGEAACDHRPAGDCHPRAADRGFAQHAAPHRGGHHTADRAAHAQTHTAAHAHSHAGGDSVHGERVTLQG
ncbi:MAG: hypothetical protein NVS3B18_13190 [Candidatus Dormibacteria bacterium]